MSDAAASSQSPGPAYGSPAGQQPEWPQAGMGAPPTVTPPQGVAAAAAQPKKGLGCWAIGAIVVGALVILGALVTLVFALLVANEVENTDTGEVVVPTGGTYATEELESVDFAFSDPETVFDDSDLLVEVAGGQLLVTSRNTSQLNIATWNADPTSALMITADMNFPGSAPTQTVLGGVAVGMADDVDYVLLCGTDGTARLERAEPSTSAAGSQMLQEFPNAGCAGTFTLELEVYSPPGAANTEVLGTLPNGTPFTFTDPGTHGLVDDYGFLADADNAPVTVAVDSLEVFTAP